PLWSPKACKTRCSAARPLASLGLVSPDSFSYYKHTVTMTSAHDDDDFIGVLVAFAKEGSTIHQLIAYRAHRFRNFALAHWITTAPKSAGGRRETRPEGGEPGAAEAASRHVAR
ncbi:MAG: hypothetical protein AAF360_19805, partial [Pseudomonadota bacterium]